MWTWTKAEDNENREYIRGVKTEHIEAVLFHEKMSITIFSKEWE
jgi:hypothetical protein